MKQGLLGAAVLSLVTQPVLSGQAVHFNGGTRLFNPGTLVAPITTTSVVCSYWYRTANTQPAVIFDSSVENLRASLLVVHQGIMGSGGVQLNVFMGGIDASWQIVSSTTLPTNGTWQHVAFAADTITKQFKWSRQGIEQQIDQDGSFFMGAGGFGMVFGNNRWSVSGANTSRARLPPIWIGGEYFGSMQGKYNGDLDEFFCYFGAGGYADITNSQRLSSGFPKANFVREFKNLAGQRVLFGPENLGPGCMAVFFTQPTLCMRGDRFNFVRAQPLVGSTGDFTVVEGVLENAVDDPFILWGPGGAPP